MGAQPTTAIPLKVACTSFHAAAISLTLVIILHFIKPEFDPSWHMISEYAIGRYGWVMTLSFLAMALSCAAIVVTVRSQVCTFLGKVGLALLCVVVLALVTAGLFAMDPITSSKDALTMHGNIHGLSSMVGVPGLPIAAMLISISLAQNPNWASVRRSILLAANFTWVSLVIMFTVIAVQLPRYGHFGPDVLAGWPNRLIWLAYCAWLLILSAQAAGLSKQNH